MKIKTAFITFVLLICIAAPALPVRAADTEEDEPTISELVDMINKMIGEVYTITGLANDNLEAQIKALKDQLSGYTPPSSAPEPVNAPRIKLLSPQTVRVRPGETAEVEVILRNIGTSVANSLLTQVSPEVDSPFALTVLNDSNTARSVREGATHSIKLRVAVDADAKSGSYKIDLASLYKDRDSKNLSENDYFIVRVVDGAEAQPAPPHVILYNFHSDRLNPKPGDSFNLTAAIENLGDETARLVQVSVEIPNGVYLTSDLNASYFNEMPSGFSSAQRFSFVVAEDAKSTTYPLTFTASFLDKEGKRVESKFIYFVNVASVSSLLAERAALEVMDFKSPQGAVGPNSDAAVSFNLINTGSNDAKNIKITAEGFDERAIMPKTANIQIINNLKPGESDAVSFVFAPTELAAARSYPIRFKIEYETGAIVDGAAEKTFFEQLAVISVASADGASLEIRSLSPPSGAVLPGGEAVISFDLFNAGEASAENIKITADNYDEGAIVPKSANIQTISSIKPGEKNSVSFAFSPTDSASSRNYTVRISVEYETGRLAADGSPVKFSFEQYAAVNVNNPDGGPATDQGKFIKPKMIVSAFSVDPQIVRAGQEFDLHLTFQNTSADRSVKNIKITLEAKEFIEKTGAVFTPVGGSNTFYIDEVGPKETTERTIRMFTVPNADPRTYNIAISFAYQDADFNEYVEAEQITVTVRQNTRIEITEPYIQDSYPLYGQVYIWMSVINSGRVSLSNLRVKIEGEKTLDTSQADMYIGNLGRGNQISYEGFFILTEPGIQQIAIVVYGEDDTGDIVEHRHEFSVNVFEMETGGGEWDGGRDVFFPEEGYGVGGAEEEVSFWSKILNFVKHPYVWGPAAGLAAAAVVVVIIIKRKKNTRLDFDE